MKKIVDDACVDKKKYSDDLAFIFRALEHNRQVGESVQKTVAEWEVQEGEGELASSSSSPVLSRPGMTAVQRQGSAATQRVEAPSGPNEQVGAWALAPGPNVEVGTQALASGPKVGVRTRAMAPGPTVEMGTRAVALGPTVEIGTRAVAPGPIMETRTRGLPEESGTASLSGECSQRPPSCAFRPPHCRCFERGPGTLEGIGAWTPRGLSFSSRTRAQRGRLACRGGARGTNFAQSDPPSTFACCEASRGPVAVIVTRGGFCEICSQSQSFGFRIAVRIAITPPGYSSPPESSGRWFKWCRSSTCGIGEPPCSKCDS
jgi:hypothetical protein